MHIIIYNVYCSGLWKFIFKSFSSNEFFVYLFTGINVPYGRTILQTQHVFRKMGWYKECEQKPFAKKKKRKYEKRREYNITDKNKNWRIKSYTVCGIIDVSIGIVIRVENSNNTHELMRWTWNEEQTAVGRLALLHYTCALHNIVFRFEFLPPRGRLE